MPYESFKSSHSVAIRGLVQDRKTGSWRYLLQVTRHMQDDAFGDASLVPRLSSDGSAASSTRHASLTNLTKPSLPATGSFNNLATRPCATQTYAIRRSFEDFKRLHEAVAPLMANARGRAKLPKLPNDSLLTFFVGETQTALQKKRLALERVLAAIENHPAASDAPAYLEFLANLNSYDQVAKAPLSPAMSSRSSFSVSEDGGVTPRDAFGGSSTLPLSRSANALRRAYFQQDAARWRRSSSGSGIQNTADENHVAFSHFSMT
ncbi:hypothetical protein BBJ28_00009498 [Nothophytophthora sp. Chile5]|nr:hypothetical protein BBJ28_00009498 [Nothophytophthora sp. Chile5]